MLSKSSRDSRSSRETKDRGLWSIISYALGPRLAASETFHEGGLLIFLANAQKGAYYLVLIGGLTT